MRASNFSSPWSRYGVRSSRHPRVMIGQRRSAPSSWVRSAAVPPHSLQCWRSIRRSVSPGTRSVTSSTPNACNARESPVTTSIASSPTACRDRSCWTPRPRTSTCRVASRRYSGTAPTPESSCCSASRSPGRCRSTVTSAGWAGRPRRCSEPFLQSGSDSGVRPTRLLGARRTGSLHMWTAVDTTSSCGG